MSWKIEIDPAAERELDKLRSTNRQAHPKVFAREDYSPGRYPQYWRTVERVTIRRVLAISSWRLSAHCSHRRLYFADSRFANRASEKCLQRLNEASPRQAAGYRLLFWPVIPCLTRLPRTGYGGIQSGPLDTGFRRYDELAASRGVSTLNGMNLAQSPWLDLCQRLGKGILGLGCVVVHLQADPEILGHAEESR